MIARGAGMTAVQEQPIWQILEHQERTLRWLARRTGYCYSYIKGLRSGQYRLTKEFIEHATFAMDLPTSVLFLPSALHDFEEVPA